VTHDPDPLEVALAVAGIFEQLQIRYTTGGSIASSLTGEPRSTVDIDMVVQLRDEQVDELVSRLERQFYVDADSLRRAVRDKGITNLIHHDTSVKVDLFVAGGTPIDEQQLERRRAVSIGANKSLYVHPPEDILLQKLRWYRKGGEASDRQWRDILGIVRVQAGRLDRTYLEANAPLLGVRDLLERALLGP